MVFMEKSKEKKKIHFIGIGGIGVSALAKYYLSRGFSVSGSDLTESEIVDDLRKLGAKVFIGHRKNNLYQCGKMNLDSRFHGKDKTLDLIVYSAAVEKNNTELKEARKRKIKCQTYAQALGELTKEYLTIAVSGTHGKSTTTAMFALIMVEAGLDPTVIVGTKLREFGNSNFRAGKSKYLVIEADEYAASFLNYWPKIIVLTNIEEDHLDYYKNLKEILKAFEEYVGHLSKDGVLVANEEDANICKIINKQSSDILQNVGGLLCDIKNYNSKFKIEGLNLKVPGKHNLMDAYATISTARALKIPDAISVRALNKFNGTWRRFEYKWEINGAKFFDDYGHHPTEIKATLQGARELLATSHKPLAKLWVVFQPHQYQRTFALFNQFVSAFDEADNIILLPIYNVAGREKESVKKKVSSEKLAEAVKMRFKNYDSSKQNKFSTVQVRFKNKKILYMDIFDKAAEYLRKNLKPGDIAVIMGAGDVYKLTGKLLNKEVL